MGTRGVAAVGALLLSLVVGSTAAAAKSQPTPLVAASYDLRGEGLVAATTPLPIQTVTRPSAASTTDVLTPVASVLYSPTLAAVRPTPLSANSSNLTNIPLAALVDANSVGDLDEEANCLATAVYFESKGEPLEGQLAVAQVVMNRAASGRFPASLCGVVKQRAQFSFVRAGSFPNHDPNCQAWRKAQAIARIAAKHLVASVPINVLWYHANYVAPRWRDTLVKVEQIGQHIFYRA